MNKKEATAETSVLPSQEASLGPPQGSSTESASKLIIVGIGASAGGLDALKRLFARMPPNAGVAYVIVAHLAPDYPSHLPDILQTATKMPVQAVTATMKVECDHVYVIPPNANLDAIDTHLRLSPLEANRSERAPIDHFFRTLATHHEGNAVGVILSGTGSDGTLGLRRIKELGGLAIVQDPIEAEHDGMPRNAIVGAPVDLVLPLAEMPAAIVRFAQTEPQLDLPSDDESTGAESRQFLQKVFAQIRARTGRDFTQYKYSTLLRRIARRMQFNSIAQPAAYLELLRKQPAEVHALASDLLINVTSFFRDPEVFELLEVEILPKIFDGKGSGETVRVWSIGCATGEEAYSLAMLLLDEAAKREAPPQVQVFATDLHQESLDRARDGLYCGAIEQDVGEDRLRRFFRREPGGFRPRSELRETVVFAPHNILADPPFSRLDLISCRNLLIYLDRDLHRQLAELFHYALNPNGFLVLGTAETVSGTELFRVDSKQRCLFRRRNVPGPEPKLPVFPSSYTSTMSSASRRKGVREPATYGSLHHDIVQLQGPPSVLVSPDDNILHFSANAGRYLVHPGGAPTSNVFKLVRDELRLELRAALSSARAGRTAVRSKPIPVRLDGMALPVVLDVRPALSADQEGFVLLLFDEHPARQEAAQRPAATPLVSPKNVPARIRELEAENQIANERHQR